MSRRKFIADLSKGVILASAGFLPKYLSAKKDLTQITILHTNDLHSRIEPFPFDGGKYQGLGGVAKRASLIKMIRAERKHVLLLDSGDILQGTPYFNFYNGELEFELMDRLGYDAVTLGNHDFDCGIEQLSRLVGNSKFETLSANYDFDGTPMQNLTKPFKIIECENVKIGVFGIGIKLKGLVPEKLFQETKYQDPIERANEISKILKNEFHCNFIICLSHLGFQYDSNRIVSDIVLARNSKHINLILGGHTHTFMDRPELVKNSKGKNVMIHQVGWAGIRLGRIDVAFHKTFGKKYISEKQILIT